MKNENNIDLIIKNLIKSKKVISENEGKHIEADTIAHGLTDIGESLKVINEFLSKLNLGNLSEEQVDDTLLDIGEELRHILYHINDMKFYSYLRINDK